MTTMKDDPMELWVDMKVEVLPSSKTIAAKAQIFEWLEDKDCKFIIFSQLLDLYEPQDPFIVPRAENSFLYHEEMFYGERNESFNQFAENLRKKILLCSLNSGGIGLNLTMADRIINLDPRWNMSVKQQAFSRVYRIWQEKESSMNRFVVQNSIDTAMMAMQERKQLEIGELMDGSKEKPTVDEVIALFGGVYDDENGRSFILPPWNDYRPRMINIDSEDEDRLMGNDE